MPHPPQLVGSFAVSTQAPPHAVVPPTHARAHAPAEHASPAAQTVPHAPQLAGSCWRSAHAAPHATLPAAQVLLMELVDAVPPPMPVTWPPEHAEKATLAAMSTAIAAREWTLRRVAIIDRSLSFCSRFLGWIAAHVERRDGSDCPIQDGVSSVTARLP
jgi:hypothetical protein